MPSVRVGRRIKRLMATGMVLCVACYVFGLMYFGDGCNVFKTYDLSRILGISFVTYIGMVP